MSNLLSHAHSSIVTIGARVCRQKTAAEIEAWNIIGLIQHRLNQSNSDLTLDAALDAIEWAYFAEDVESAVYWLRRGLSILEGGSMRRAA